MSRGNRSTETQRLIDILKAAGRSRNAAEKVVLASQEFTLDEVTAPLGTAAYLDVGVGVQAYDAKLAALAGLTGAADKLPYFTGASAMAVTDFTNFGRSIVQWADAVEGRSDLGLEACAQAAYLGAPGPLSGAWMMPFGAGTSLTHPTSSFAANRIYLSLWCIAKPCTLNTVKFRKDASVGTPFAGKNCKLVVYACGSDGWPSTRLYVSAATALSDSSGTTTFSSIATAITGNVWIGLVLDSAVTYTGGASECRMYVPAATNTAGWIPDLSTATIYRTVAYDDSYSSPMTTVSGTKVFLGSLAQPCVYPEFT